MKLRVQNNHSKFFEEETTTICHWMCVEKERQRQNKTYMANECNYTVILYIDFLVLLFWFVPFVPANFTHIFTISFDDTL